jgi:Zn-ribbon protein, possibly nucleic acid-binding
MSEMKEITVEERLKALYKLQTIFSEIDRIRILRGELPHEVQDLEDEIAGLRTRVENNKAKVEDCRRIITTLKNEISEANLKIANLNDQQNNVSNNRQYDAIVREIGYQKMQVTLAEKRINDNDRQANEINEEIARTEALVVERTADLEQKKKELDEIVAETRQEEENLRKQAKELEATIGEGDRYLTAFNRIRKNARNGLAAVPVERSACGGCFNKIPPQRELDIKLHKKVIVCEFCGRILVDSDLAKEVRGE